MTGEQIQDSGHLLESSDLSLIIELVIQGSLDVVVHGSRGACSTE